MTKNTIAVLPTVVQPHIQGQLPDWLEARWFATRDEALALAPQAQIGWFDMRKKEDMEAAILRATDMKWLNSLIAGVDGFPLATLRERKLVFTNGAGINAITIAEYVVLGMLSIAKGYREVVRAQERHEWLADAPGKVELCGSKALLLGHGAIGKLIEARLKAFDVAVTVVRRTPDASGHTLGPDQWRPRLGEFDWVILALPATPETGRMIGAGELSAMKPSAVLLNIARGSLVDQDALVDALRSKRIGGAFLDVTDPEPLPAGHALWTLENAHLSMHMSGRSQTLMFKRAAQRFLENLARYRRGDALLHQVDLELGY
jgi:phosphoglycerate dehydrogenase-like enzyme